MDYPTCIRTVRALADGEAAFAAALSRLDDRAFDGRRYAEFLVANRLVPFLSPVLADAAVRARFPEDALQTLDDRLAVGARRTGSLLAGTRSIGEVLAGEAIPFLVLKGLAFGRRFYGDVRRRWQFDLDLLVHAQDRARALDLLGRHGFVPDGPPAGRGSVRQGMRRDDFVIDLHWNLRRRARRALPEEVLWEAPVPFDLQGVAYETLSDEYAITFQTIAMCGDLRRGACNARQFLDLYMMLRAVEGHFGWDGFFARRRPQALLKPCINVLAVLLTVWGVAEDLPSLARAVTRRRRLLDPRDGAEALALVQRPRDNAENPVWYRRVYPYSRKADWARRLTVDLPHTLRRALVPGRGVPWAARRDVAGVGSAG